MLNPFAHTLGLLPIVNVIFNQNDLKEFFEQRLGKIGPHVKITSSNLITAIIGNLLNCAAESLYATSEFYSKRPTRSLFGCEPEEINRFVIGRLLDKIYDYGCAKLFLEFSGYVFNKNGIKAEAGHMDTSSFHYHGNSFTEEGAIEITYGYSRDNHPELKQYGANMIIDELTNLPIAFRAISGNKSDKTEFAEFTEAYNLTLKTYHSELKYFVEDSAGMTKQNIEALEKAGLYLVTRIPDNFKFTKESYKIRLDKFTPIYKDQENSALGYMLPDVVDIEGHKYKALCVYNPNMITKKTKTVMRKAEENLNSANASLKQLSKMEFDSKKEAEKALKKSLSKKKFIKIDSIDYVEVVHKKRGRPRADGTSNTAKFKVICKVSFDQLIIDNEIDMEVRHTIITTDYERKWTMQELFEMYHHQQKVERGWRMMKSPRFFVDSTFLKNPSRIEAFLWLMTMALFVLTLFTNQVQKAMADNKLTIPSPSKEKKLEKPTAQRLTQYIHNMNILVIGSESGEIKIWNLDSPLKAILTALGPGWIAEFQADRYKFEYWPIN